MEVAESRIRGTELSQRDNSQMQKAEIRLIRGSTD